MSMLRPSKRFLFAMVLRMIAALFLPFGAISVHAGEVTAAETIDDNGGADLVATHAAIVAAAESYAHGEFTKLEVQRVMSMLVDFAATKVVAANQRLADEQERLSDDEKAMLASLIRAYESLSEAARALSRYAETQNEVDLREFELRLNDASQQISLIDGKPGRRWA